jgi:hypothetical protein
MRKAQGIYPTPLKRESDDEESVHHFLAVFEFHIAALSGGQ